MEEKKPLENTTPKPVTLPETPEITPTTPVVQQKKKPWMKIVILLFVISLFCAGLVFAGMEIQKRQVSNSSTASPEVSVTPTPDPIANWETYENLKAGISFKYPNDWIISFGEKNNMVINLQKVDQTQEKVDLPGDTKQYPEYWISINLPPNEKTEIPKVSEKVIVGGKEGVKFTQGAAPSSGLTTTVQVQSGDSLYVFNYSAMAFSATHNKYLGIFDQILSTFKFLDETAVNKDLELASEALTQFFSLLNSKQYSKAIVLYGGGESILQDWNHDIASTDKTALWERGCEQNGLQCLKIKTIISSQIITPSDFNFVVQFENNDGTLFKHGPCCGATEKEIPTKTEFEFKVKKIGEEFKVMDLPIYRP